MPDVVWNLITEASAASGTCRSQILRTGAFTESIIRQWLRREPVSASIYELKVLGNPIDEAGKRAKVITTRLCKAMMDQNAGSTC